MAKMKSKNYKYCVVPMCNNTSVTTPSKIFFTLPKSQGRGEEWCRLMRRPPMSNKGCYYCCEDHFNLKEDARNYWEYQLMNVLPRLKIEAVPSRFACQKNSEALLAHGYHSKKDIIEIRRHIHENPIEENKVTDFVEFCDVKIEPVEIKTEQQEQQETSTSSGGEELDFKLRNDTIVSDNFEIKKEFSEEATVITYGGSDYTNTEDILLTKIKREPCDDENQNELNEQELDASKLPSNAFKIKNSDELDLKKSHNDKQYKCDVCKKKFKNRNRLASHMKRYTSEKPFKCDFCEKKYAHSSQLVRHFRMHTGEKPFKCDICEKKFKDSSVLKKHVALHTDKNKPSETFENQYKCEFCEKTFAENIALEEHIGCHTGEKQYKCDVCAKRFVQSNHLLSHMRQHVGDKPYKCNICNKRFASGSDLAIHTRVHTGEKPYKCDLCEKKFGLSIQLAKHIRWHSGEKLRK